jgi:choline-sulfatase
MEYAAEASEAPIVALRDGRWKYVRCELDPEMLFDLEADPQELRNLAGRAGSTWGARGGCGRWRTCAGTSRLDAEVRESQARRWVVYEALRNGATSRGTSSRCARRPSGTCATTWT